MQPIDKNIQNNYKRALEKLSPSEAYIFQFYHSEIIQNTLDLIPPGKTYHLNFLREISSNSPSLWLQQVNEALRNLKRQTFNSKASKMVDLAKACANLRIDPDDYLNLPMNDTNNKVVEKPSLSKVMARAFDGARLDPRCPHAKATFDWWDHSHRPRAKKWNITACRVLFSNLVTEEDIKFEWLAGTAIPNTVLEIKVRYPDMMNFPAEMSCLVTDKHGNLVFHRDHACTQAFAAEINERQTGEDGYVYDKFYISFDEEQDPVFVPIDDANLTGFDLLQGKYINRDNEPCDFKLLQILIRNKDLDENRSGAANLADGGTCMPDTVSSGGPFSSPDHHVRQVPQNVRSRNVSGDMMAEITRLKDERDLQTARERRLQAERDAQTARERKLRAERDERERKLRADADAKLREERRIREEAESKIREEAEAKIREERQIREQAEAKIREERRIREQAETKIREERQIREQAEAKIREERRIRDEAEAKTRKERKIREEAEAKIREEQKSREDAEEQAREERRIRKDREESEARICALADERIRCEREKAEAELRKAKDTATTQAQQASQATENKVRAEADERLKRAEADVKARAEERIQYEKEQAEERVRAESKAFDQRVQAAVEERIRREKEDFEAHVRKEAEEMIQAELSAAERIINEERAAAKEVIERETKIKEKLEATLAADHKRFQEEQDASAQREMLVRQELERVQSTDLAEQHLAEQQQQIVHTNTAALLPPPPRYDVDPNILDAMELIAQARKRRAVDISVTPRASGGGGDGGNSAGSSGVQGADGVRHPVSAYVEYMAPSEEEPDDVSTIDAPLEFVDDNMTLSSGLMSNN